MKDEIKLAYVLKASIKRLDKDLYEVEDTELAFALIYDKDKVEGSVMPVDDTEFVFAGSSSSSSGSFLFFLFLFLALDAGEGYGVGGGREEGSEFGSVEKVADAVGTLGDEAVDESDERLLSCGWELRVEFGQPSLAMVVDDEHGADCHADCGCVCGCGGLKRGGGGWGAVSSQVNVKLC